VNLIIGESLVLGGGQKTTCQLSCFCYRIIWLDMLHKVRHQAFSFVWRSSIIQAACLARMLYMNMKLLIGLLALGVTMIAVGLVIVFVGLP
jgi:hypothetical protein